MRDGYAPRVPIAPTPPAARLVHLDVLRGLALCGVLLENLQHFVEPSYAMIVASGEATALDRLVFAGIRLLCDNKIYAIFSLLFGFGVASQMQRAAAAGEGFVGLHLWRMAILFLFGLAHSLVWAGDILSTYALLGVVLLVLRRRSERTLLAVGALGFVLPVIAGGALLAVAERIDPAALTRLQATVAEQAYPLRQSAYAFGAFALGMWCARTGAFVDPAATLRRARRALAPALVVGLAANLWALPLLSAPGQGSLTREGWQIEALLALATPLLTFVYVCGGLAIARAPRLAPLAALGRTTLTQYLLQSVIGVGLLARTGLGPLGEITPSAGVLVTAAVLAVQLLLARAWLARLPWGPAEWLWRAATYGRLPRATDAPSDR